MTPEGRSPLEARTLRPGSWKKPAIRLVPAPPGTASRGMVVEKDYRGLSPLLRWYGLLILQRERRAYRELADVGAVPNLLASRDRVLALEYVQGMAISRLTGTERGPAAFSSLERAVAAIHARGVYHLDLRKRDNILVGADGNVHILDFASAFRVREGSVLGWLTGPILRFFDHYAVLKWKAALNPASMLAWEWSRIRWLSALRRRRSPPAPPSHGPTRP